MEEERTLYFQDYSQINQQLNKERKSKKSQSQKNTRDPSQSIKQIQLPVISPEKYDPPKLDEIFMYLEEGPHHGYLGELPKDIVAKFQDFFLENKLKLNLNFSLEKKNSLNQYDFYFFGIMRVVFYLNQIFQLSLESKKYISTLVKYCQASDKISIKKGLLPILLQDAQKRNNNDDDFNKEKNILQYRQNYEEILELLLRDCEYTGDLNDLDYTQVTQIIQYLSQQFKVNVILSEQGKEDYTVFDSLKDKSLQKTQLEENQANNNTTPLAPTIVIKEINENTVQVYTILPAFKIIVEDLNYKFDPPTINNGNLELLQNQLAQRNLSFLKRNKYDILYYFQTTNPLEALITNTYVNFIIEIIDIYNNNTQSVNQDRINSLIKLFKSPFRFEKKQNKSVISSQSIHHRHSSQYQPEDQEHINTLQKLITEFNEKRQKGGKNQDVIEILRKIINHYEQMAPFLRQITYYHEINRITDSSEAKNMKYIRSQDLEQKIMQYYYDDPQKIRKELFPSWIKDKQDVYIILPKLYCQIVKYKQNPSIRSSLSKKKKDRSKCQKFLDFLRCLFCCCLRPKEDSLDDEIDNVSVQNKQKLLEQNDPNSSEIMSRPSSNSNQSTFYHGDEFTFIFDFKGYEESYNKSLMEIKIRQSVSSFFKKGQFRQGTPSSLQIGQLENQSQTLSQAYLLNNDHTESDNTSELLLQQNQPILQNLNDDSQKEEKEPFVSICNPEEFAELMRNASPTKFCECGRHIEVYITAIKQCQNCFFRRVHKNI